eukprot:GFUD01011295.1.p1 GENE.GFUD01011295.1~~GFUD01011295.1.p1  ORF type:complete len:473 (+),score=126.28 GFUD01011295.1:388-1806(+)
MGDMTVSKLYFLSLMTLSYIVGELTHFLINTTSREVAREVEFGEKSCFVNGSFVTDEEEDKERFDCSESKNETQCGSEKHCYWEYSGLGIQYQVLAGPSFILVFIFSAVFLAILSDWLYDKLSRTLMLSVGTATFSTACLLMGLAGQYWQLVILRMMIAAGLSVCRPVSGGLIAELFSASSRGVANGIFSWGVYYGYGLAFVFGIYITRADVLGYGWRAPYVLAALPGLVLAVLLATTVKDPRQKDTEATAKASSDGRAYFRTLARSFLSPSMLILLLAAFFRHTAGYCWAYNTRLFFQTYYPDFDIGLWTFSASVFGGSFGVFAGGFFSDRLVQVLGLPSRLWLLSACTLLAAPLAVGTLYFPPPGAFGCLIVYYFFAETWFAVLFTVIVEIVDPEVRSTCIAIFLFLMNLVGGNLPVIVAPLRSYFNDYRSALYLVWPGFLTISAFIFLLSSLPLWIREKKINKQYNVNK